MPLEPQVAAEPDVPGLPVPVRLEHGARRVAGHAPEGDGLLPQLVGGGEVEQVTGAVEADVLDPADRLQAAGEQADEQTPLVGVQFDSKRLVDVSGQGLSGPVPLPFPSAIFFDLDTAAFHKQIPAPLAWIDFCRQTQPSAHTASALVAIPFVDTELFPEYPTPGLYHLDSLLGNPTLVPTPGLNMAGPPRWLQSWRRSPGFDPFEGVR